MALTSGTRFGAFEITALIGGGMGEVNRARDTRLGRDVAIKVLPDALTQDRDRIMRFEREARSLASLNHPHIAHVYAWSTRPRRTPRAVPRAQLSWNWSKVRPCRIASREDRCRSRTSCRIEERYRGLDDYLQRVRSAAMVLIRQRLVLAEDLDAILERAKSHRNFATRVQEPASPK